MKRLNRRDNIAEDNITLVREEGGRSLLLQNWIEVQTSKYKEIQVNHMCRRIEVKYVA